MRTVISALILIAISGQAQAQSKTDVAQACVDAIDAGDTATVEELAAEIVDWRAMFGTKAIRDAEQCLEAATGEFWKYLPSKGQFLSGDEARAEQEYVDSANERRAARESELERLTCEAVIAQSEIANLEAEFESIQQLRATEALRETIAVCGEIYGNDKAAALLEPVCNDLFMSVGIPDTAHSFEFEELQEARARFANAALGLARLNPRGTVEEAGRVEECRALIGQ